MSPAVRTMLTLLVLLLGALVSASGQVSPGQAANPVDPTRLTPFNVPNPVMFRTALIPGLDLSAPVAPRQFDVPSADKPLTVGSPGRPLQRKFSFPHVRIRSLRDSLCYFVRSYRVARESRESDVTTPVGFRTCTPATKFQVKSADLPSR